MWTLRTGAEVSEKIRGTMSKRIVTVSKFMSKCLRHEPEVLGLNLEPGGWVLIEELLAGAERIGFRMTRDEPASGCGRKR